MKLTNEELFMVYFQATLQVGGPVKEAAESADQAVVEHWSRFKTLEVVVDDYEAEDQT